MDRKELKRDIFVEEVTHSVEVLSAHKPEVKLYGGIAVALLVAGFGYYFYSSSQATARQLALAEVKKIDTATIGPNKQDPLLNFQTLDAKNAARVQGYTNLAAKYPGTQEGAIAQMILAAMQVDAGKLADAEKSYKAIVDSAPADYGSVAAVALANVYMAQDKAADAEKVMKTVVEHPTTFISKEQATVYLAQIIGKSRPAEARKMLEPLRTARSAISRAAIQTLGELGAAN